MLLIFIALAAGGGALALYLVVERVGAPGVPLALLRAAAWGLLAALIADPGCRRVVAARTTVLLDASLSMTDPSGDARWRAALDSARAIAGREGRILLFGGPAPRPLSEGSRPDQPSSLLLPALREAASGGGRIAIVTDGAIDDAASLPTDVIGRARIAIVPRRAGTDAGIAALDLPPSLRATDTAAATVDIAVSGAGPRDSVTLELLEQGRVLARSRIALGGVGTLRREVKFVPATLAARREVRFYQARLGGLAGDVEPRDDRRATAALVRRAGAISAFSDSPDWDFRWLVTTLGATAGVPVRGFVRLGGAGWRDARTLRPVGDAAIRDEAAEADLVIVQGNEAGTALPRRAARGAMWLLVPAGPGAMGDWYVAREASPLGSALASVPAESLPPLEGVSEAAADSSAWTALTAQLDRRGRPRPVMRGWTSGQRRMIVTSASGLWRWASRGGVAGEAYRALVAAGGDWLLEDVGREGRDLAAVRDSLARGTAEFLPRPALLRPQAGYGLAATAEPVPLRHRSWVYFAALAAVALEWVARRRMGLR